MQCGRMPFAVPKRCIIGQRFRNQRRSETMIFTAARGISSQFRRYAEKSAGFGKSAGRMESSRIVGTNFDKDQILILVLLVMLYKEGGDKKLMMALAYLLT